MASSDMCTRLDLAVEYVLKCKLEDILKEKEKNKGEKLEESCKNSTEQKPKESVMAEDVPKNPAKAKNLAREGNAAFLLGTMATAITYYTAALEFDPENAEILSNRAAAYIRVNAFEKATQDLMKALYNEGKPSLKTLHRLSKALWGLRKFDVIIKCLEGINATGQWNVGRPEHDQLLKLLDKSKRMRKETFHGKYDMKTLLVKENQTYDCGEYQGFVKIQGVPGKGLGLIATENIYAGETILSTKAFAITSPEVPKSMNKSKTQEQDMDSAVREEFTELYDDTDKLLRKLVEIIKDIIIANPEAGNDFYKLYAGKKLGRLNKFSTPPAPNNGDGDGVDPMTDRIHQICKLNAIFSVSNPDPGTVPKPNEVDDNRMINTYGIWLLPSFANHSCWGVNCDHQIYGDFLIMRAVTDIKKGDEILISYIRSTKPYEERVRDLGDFEFTCSCHLCQTESEESMKTHKKREQLTQLFLKTFRNSCSLQQPDEYARRLLDILRQMDELRKDNRETNLCALWVNKQLACHYIANKSPDLGVMYFEEAYLLTQNTSLAREGIRFLIHITFHHFRMNNVQKAQKWLKTLTNRAIALYGTSDVLSVLMLRENYDPHELMKLLCLCLQLDESYIQYSDMPDLLSKLRKHL